MKVMWQGHVVSLHIAPEASAKMQTISAARAVPGRGLEGDRYFSGTGFYSKRPSDGGRQVTLIEIESVQALDYSEAGDRRLKLSPADSRRNIATEGVPLNHLVGKEFWVGPVLMRGTRLCEPCTHLDELTQPGVMSGLIHRGGLRAEVLTGGVIRPGDLVRPNGQ